MRERLIQTFRPLLHEDATRYDYQNEKAPSVGISCGLDGNIRLTCPCDSFDNSSSTTPQPANESFELPPVQKVVRPVHEERAHIRIAKSAPHKVSEFCVFIRKRMVCL